jgi:hypothetical protein
MPTHEIVFAGAAKDQGGSMLRWWSDDGRELYIALFSADGSWSSLTVLDDEPRATDRVRVQ